MNVPSAGFFKDSPVLEMIDFLELLAPVSEPNMLVSVEWPPMAVGFWKASGECLS